MVTIAIIQFQPLIGNPEGTIKKLELLFDKIETADFIVLPELANSGYNFNDKNHAFEFSEDLSDSQFIRFLQQTAHKKNSCIISGINERDQNKIYNSSVLISSKGIEGKYRKIHLFMREKEFFEPGNYQPEVIKLPNAKAGMLICFDYMFPEVWRSLALKGAEIIFHPSNLVTPYGQRIVPTHAITNGIFVVTANRIGTEGNITFSGNSIAVNPKGKLLAEGKNNMEEIILTSVNPDEANDKMVTERNHVIHDRRPEYYI